LFVVRYTLIIIFGALNWLKKKITFSPEFELRVLLYHEVDIRDIENFKRQIKWLKKHTYVLTPDEFCQVIDKKKSLSQNSILITFDDGLISSYYATKAILDPLSVKSIFFLVSDYIECNKANWKLFYLNKINPDFIQNGEMASVENIKNNNIVDLINSGHCIGAHTKTHKRLSNISCINDLNMEIIQSSESLENIYTIRIQHFAYTFGDISSFSKEALELASEKFNYIHTGIRGNNSIKLNPKFINRESISPRDGILFLWAVLNGGADTFYRRASRIYNGWLNNSLD